MADFFIGARLCLCEFKGQMRHELLRQGTAGCQDAPGHALAQFFCLLQIKLDIEDFVKSQPLPRSVYVCCCVWEMDFFYCVSQAHYATAFAYVLV